MSEYVTFDKWYFVPTQLMRVHIYVSKDRWELEGVPAEKPLPEDVILENQYELLKKYEPFGFYKVGFVDWLMSWPEQVLGPVLNRRRERKGWKHEGKFPEDKDRIHRLLKG